MRARDILIVMLTVIASQVAAVNTPSSVVSNMLSAIERGADKELETYLALLPMDGKAKLLDEFKQVQQAIRANTISCEVVGEHVVSNIAIVMICIFRHNDLVAGNQSYCLTRIGDEWLLLPYPRALYVAENDVYVKGRDDIVQEILDWDTRLLKQVEAAEKRRNTIDPTDRFTDDDRVKMVGTWSNKKDGFGACEFFIAQTGRGLYSAAVWSTILHWTNTVDGIMLTPRAMAGENTTNMHLVFNRKNNTLNLKTDANDCAVFFQMNTNAPPDYEAQQDETLKKQKHKFTKAPPP